MWWSKLNATLVALEHWTELNIVCGFFFLLRCSDFDVYSSASWCAACAFFGRVNMFRRANEVTFPHIPTINMSDFYFYHFQSWKLAMRIFFDAAFNLLPNNISDCFNWNFSLFSITLLNRFYAQSKLLFIVPLMRHLKINSQSYPTSLCNL